MHSTTAWTKKITTLCEGEEVFWKLADVPSFFKFAIKPTVLYRRPCYSGLESLLWKGSHCICGVTGNPGIGKTYFGLFLVVNAVLEKKTVVYQRGETPYLITSDRSCRWHDCPISVDMYIYDAFLTYSTVCSDIPCKKWSIYIHLRALRKSGSWCKV